jgi:hypothetical protein
MYQLVEKDILLFILQCFGTDIGYYIYSLLKLTVPNNVINIKTKVPLFVWGRLSSGIFYQLREIYSMWGCCWNVATYKRKIWNHLCCRNVSFLSAPQCQFRCVGQAMKQSYLWLISKLRFLYSYEADFLQVLLKKNEKKLTHLYRWCPFTK